MAKKWKKKEIDEYLSTKQISQDNYVAPTVQTNYTPSVASTVDAFNSVQPTIKSVEPTIQTTQTTMSLEDKDKEKERLYDELITSKTGDERQKGIQEYNKRIKELYGDKTKQDTQNRIQEYNDKVAKAKGEKTSKEKAKEQEENNVLSAFKDGYNFGDATRTASKFIEKKVVDPLYDLAEEGITGDKLKFIGKGIGAGALGRATGFVEAPLQNMQEGAQKGQEKSNMSNYLEGLLKTADVYGISTLPETANEIQQVINDPNKTGMSKAINIGLKLLNNNKAVRDLEAAGQQFNIFDKNAENDIKEAREIVRKPSEKLNQQIEKESKNYSKAVNTLNEVGQGFGNMASDVLLSAFSKNPNIQNINLLTMGISAKGQSTTEAEKRGADLGTANEIGLGKGLVEVGTEKISDVGSKWFGKGVSDDIVTNTIDKFIPKNKALNFITKRAVGDAGEILEEEISGFVDAAIDRATIDPNAKFTWDDMKKTALTTLLTTELLNTTYDGLNFVKTGKTSYQLNAQELEQIAKNKKVEQVVEERVNELKTPDMTEQQVNELRATLKAGVLGDIQQNIDDIVASGMEQLQEQPQMPTQTPINTLSSNIQEQNNQILGQEQTPQITPLNQVNQELQETRQNDIANQVQAMNLETPQKISLEQQLENRASKIIEDAINTEDGMIKNFENYIEENDIKNPNQQDIDNSLVDILGYDNEMTPSEKQELKNNYNKVINEYLSKQENKTTQEEKPQETPKNEVKQEVKKSYLTSAEQNELDGLKAVENSGFAELTKEEQARMEELEKKSQGITKKFPELKTKNTFDDIKSIYGKYKNSEISKENNKVLNEAKNIVEANKQGRRTIEEWKQIAEYIGSNADIKNSQDLQKLAMETWFNQKPNNPQNLNRQGKKYVKFGVDDWVNAVYKGAGVGQEVNLNKTEKTPDKKIKQELNNSSFSNEKNTINETKKDAILTLKDTKGKKVDLKPTGNNTYEEINVKPKKTDVIPDMSNKVLNIGNEKVSNFYSNITEKSKFITEENREALKDNANLQYYDAITNKETLENAMDKLNKNPEQQTGDFFAKKEFTPEDVATGWILVKRYQDVGNYEAMSNVIEKMREQGTKAGQTVQMYGILQRLTPEGMEYYSQKQLDNAFKKFSEGKSKQKIEQYAPDFTLTAEEHQFIKDTMEKVQNMTDEEQKKVEIAKIVSMLNEKIPPEKGQRLKAWMRIAMLGNPKTQVRNVAGNAIIQPVNWVGDVFSATADKIISKKTGKRTIGTTDFGALVQGTKKGFKDAVRDAKTGVDTRDINLDRFEENIGANPFYEKHEGAKKILNPAAKVLNKTNRILGNIMSGGDRIFYQAVYDNSLQNQMKLNKVDKPTQEMIDIATQEALSRTWNDSNSYTKSVLQIRNAMNKLNVKGYGLGDVLVPFAKTPANLTKAIVDYSPVGLTRTILQDGKKLKNSLENGQYNAQLQHQFADSFGKGVAGTILWTAAYALAKAGITSGKSDDDKDVANFMRNTLGIQPYSIKIGDKSFTYDWAQPIAAPFAAMADYQSLTDKEKKDLGSTIEKMTSSASNILLEQSFLSSIQDVFNSYEGPTAAIKQQIQDLPARATPTFFKQIADLIDPTSRQTFVKGDTKETMKNKVQVKIPGKSKELVEQRDTLGREIKKYGGDEDKLKYAFNVFLNPANTNKGKKSEAAEEIYNVYKATGDKTIMPRQVGYSEMISGKSRNLTPKERSEWQKRAGQKVEENIKTLSKNPEYKGLSNEDKATVISNIVNYSFSIQKEEMFKAGVSNLYKKAYEAEQDGIPIADFYLEKMENYIERYR